MLSKEVFGGLATVMSVYTFAVYLHGMWRGKTKPHVFSWIIWGGLLLITCAAQLVRGAGPGAWMTALDTVASLGIAGIAARHNKIKITRSDWYAFIAALLAVPLWVFTGDPLLSVLLVTMISVSGFWPTFRKSWSEPWTEVAQTYLIAGPAYGISLAAIDRFSWTTAFYPAVLMLVNLGFGIVLVLRRRAMRAG